MTWHFFRHHPGPNCMPLLTWHLHQGLIAHGEHLIHRSNGWTENLHRHRGWAPEVACVVEPSIRPPLSPKEAWLGDGR